MKKIVSLLLGIISLGSCAQKSTDYPQIDSTKMTIERVSQEAFKKFLTENEKVQLIDVRTAQEVAQGKIEGAVNIDVMSGDFETQVAKLDQSIPTLVYCRSGGRSMQSLQVFKKLNFQYVLELEGGFMSWKK